MKMIDQANGELEVGDEILIQKRWYIDRIEKVVRVTKTQAILSNYSKRLRKAFTISGYDGTPWLESIGSSSYDSDTFRFARKGDRENIEHEQLVKKARDWFKGRKWTEDELLKIYKEYKD